MYNTTNITVHDALKALNHHTGYNVGCPDLGVVRQFLERLIKMAEPESTYVSDTEAYVIEGAMQNGFDNIDDNADLFVVHANDLVKFVLAQSAYSAADALQCTKRADLPPIVLSIRDEVKLGQLVTEFGNALLQGEGRLRKDVFDDLRELMGITQAAAPKWVDAKITPLEPSAQGLVVKAWNADAGHLPHVWAGAHPQGIKVLSCDWYIHLPDVPAAK